MRRCFLWLCWGMGGGGDGTLHTRHELYLFQKINTYIDKITRGWFPGATVESVWKHARVPWWLILHINWTGFGLTWVWVGPRECFRTAIQVNCHFCTCRAHAAVRAPEAGLLVLHVRAGVWAQRVTAAGRVLSPVFYLREPQLRHLLPQMSTGQRPSQAGKVLGRPWQPGAYGLADCPIVILISISCNTAATFHTSSCLHY